MFNRIINKGDNYMKKIYKIFICLIMLFGFGLASCSNGSANEVPT